MIPLMLRIKKESHKAIARSQDMIVKELFSAFNSAVLHGGTAIWRCYAGNRFSEDIDAYITRDLNKVELFFEKLKKAGFEVEKKKIGENSLYSSLKFERVNVRFEALFKKMNGSLREYETADGNKITVYSLTAEELVNEKSETYLKRMKIRDLYDIFYLLRFVKDGNEVKESLQKLITHFKEPVDEQDLKALILEGLVPTSKKMMEYIKHKV